MKTRIVILIFFSLSILIGSCNREQILKTEIVKPTATLMIKNIQIDSSNYGTGACEPSICISPVNKDIVVAGSILDRVYYSEDGGKSWNKNKMESSSGVYGDPVVRADFKGNFYFSHLANPTGNAWQDEEFLDRIVTQKSTDGGKTWNDGSYTRPNNPKDQDKQWLAIDPNDNTVYMTWTEFDLYDSKDPKDKSRIMFAKSTDEGDSWTEPLPISELEGDCLDSDQTTEGAVPAVSSDGKLFVAWSYDEMIYFDRSFDQGKTWLEKDIVVADQPGGWDFPIHGIMRCNGMPITEVDQSNGPHKGDIYVNWSDQRNGEKDTDIWISKSTDDGDTWSAPKRVNDDLPGKDQFFTWMDVDPITGYIYIVFYDRRDHEVDDRYTDVYLAYSTDGAASFTNIKISETPFQPNKYVFFGDYNDISAYDGRVRPIWTRLDKAKLSVWTCLLEF